jgi:hypothetical protein
VERRNLFQDINFPKSYLPQITVVITSKTQIKEKLLKENMGYLPRVLFFNAFGLGTK